MRGLTYCDGWFPFPIRGEGSATDTFSEWDGSTTFEVSGIKTPSGSSSKLVEVYGNGSRRPCGFTREEFSAMYWRVRRWELSLPNEETLLSVPSISTSGGYYSGLTWNPTSATAAASTVVATEIDLSKTELNQNVRGSEVGHRWNAADSEWIDTLHDIMLCPGTEMPGTGQQLWAPWDGDLLPIDSVGFDIFPFPWAYLNAGKTATSEDPQSGAYAMTSAQFAFATRTFSDTNDPVASPFVFTDTIFADGKYWPKIGSFWFFAQVQRIATHDEQDGPAPGVVTVSDSDESRYCEAVTAGASGFDLSMELAVPVEIVFLGKTHSFNLAVRSIDAEPFDPAVFTVFPTIRIAAGHYWSQGGIYDEDTGERL